MQNDHREYNAEDRRLHGEPAEISVGHYLMVRGCQVEREPYGKHGIDWKFTMPDGRKGLAEAESKKQWHGPKFHFPDINWMESKVEKYNGNYEDSGLTTYYFLVNCELTHVCISTFSRIELMGRNLGRKNSDNLALLTTPKKIARIEDINDY